VGTKDMKKETYPCSSWRGKLHENFLDGPSWASSRNRPGVVSPIDMAGEKKKWRPLRNSASFLEEKTKEKGKKSLTI